MYKKLYRSKHDIKIAGICAGIGNYYNTDPTMVRLFVAFVGIATGLAPAILLYIGAWIIIPIEE